MFLACLACLGCFVIIVNFTRGLSSVEHARGLRPLLSPLSVFGVIIPTCWWNPGRNWHWKWRVTSFFNHSYEVISMVPIIWGSPYYYVGSIEVTKQLLGHEGKNLFKPRELTSALWIWGENVFSANADVWKRHRRIMAPAFTTKTYALVVKETISTYRAMLLAEGWDCQNEVVVENFNRIPTKFALIIISRCGFGLPMPWSEEPGDQKLSFGEALTIVSKTTITRLIVPKWAYKLPISSLRDMDHAWSTLSGFMRKFVEKRKEELTDQGDVFSRLVAASIEARKYSLNDQEVIGNTFTLMFAGHESTANVLSATLGYLAIYQKEQEKAYSEIIRTIPHDRNPELSDLSNLNHLLACFHETARLYPPGLLLARDTTEDTPVRVTRPTEKTMVFKRGTRIIIDMVALHHDPSVFPEPEVFRPSRMYGISEHEATSFGVGPRACIGRKFAHVEGLCFLALFLRDWQVDAVLQPNETRQQYEQRVMGNAGAFGLAFGVGSIPLKLKRRM